MKELWDVGVETYDISTGHTSQMKAALMWTINDFPAYGMLSGWSTHGLTVIRVFCQGIMRSEEIEQHLGKAELLQGVLVADYLGKNFMPRWKNN